MVLSLHPADSKSRICHQQCSNLHLPLLTHFLVHSRAVASYLGRSVLYVCASASSKFKQAMLVVAHMSDLRNQRVVRVWVGQH
jgi:hypothetical protein